jgi:hypothetical protein
MSGTQAPEEIRINTARQIASLDNVTILAHILGELVGVSPALLVPTLSQLGAASPQDIADAVAGLQRKADRGLANGYAPLGSDGKVPAINLPAASSGGVGLSDATPLGPATPGAPGTADGASRADHRHPLPTLEQLGAAPVAHTHGMSAITGLSEALGAKQNASGRGAPNGYAPLDSNGIVPPANLPQGISASDLDAKASESSVQTRLATKLDTTALAPALAGYVPTTDPLYLSAIQPNNLAKVEEFSGNYSIAQPANSTDPGDRNKTKSYTGTTAANVTLTARGIGTVVKFVVRKNAGNLTFVADTGVSIESVSNLVTTIGPGAVVVAEVIAANVWSLAGDLA